MATEAVDIRPPAPLDAVNNTARFEIQDILYPGDTRIYPWRDEHGEVSGSTVVSFGDYGTSVNVYQASQEVAQVRGEILPSEDGESTLNYSRLRSVKPGKNEAKLPARFISLAGDIVKIEDLRITTPKLTSK